MISRYSIPLILLMLSNFVLMCRILPLWFGARGVEFDWKYVQMSLDANISLVWNISGRLIGTVQWIWWIFELVITLLNGSWLGGAVNVLHKFFLKLCQRHNRVLCFCPVCSSATSIYVSFIHRRLLHAGVLYQYTAVEACIYMHRWTGCILYPYNSIFMWS